MGHSNQPVIKVTGLQQVCLAVRDLDRTMESLWNTFGMGPWEIYVRDFNSTSPDESLTDMTYYGKPAKFSFKVAIARSQLGGIIMELIQPVAGDSIYRDFVRDYGDGVHHLGWHVVDSLEGFNETIKTLEKEGFPCIMSGRTYNAAFAYIDTTKVLNTILEVVWRDQTKSQLAPCRVFPE